MQDPILKLSAMPYRRLFGAALALGAAGASNVRAESLQEAVAEAFVHNPQLAASKADQSASQEVVAQAKAQYGPNLQADASYGYEYQRVVPSARGPSIDGWNTRAGASLSQPLYTSGRLTGQLARARANESATSYQVRASELNLISSVIASYASVLRDVKLVFIAQQNVNTLQDQLNQVSARYQARYATATDLNQTENRLNFSLAQLAIARGNLNASRNGYRNLVGHYPGELTPLPPMPALPASLDDAQSLAQQNNPTLAATQQAERASRAALAVARGQRGPTVSLNGSLSRSPTGFADTPSVVAASGRVQVSMPLYTSGLLTAQVREAIARNDADNQRIEQSSRDVRESVATLWDGLSATRRALPAYARAVAAAASAFEGAQKQETAGQITSLDVLVTAQDLLNSRTAQAQAEALLYIQHARLLESLGMLDIGAFAPSLKSYDPATYRATSVVGLPAGPLIMPIDSVLSNDDPKHGPVQVEKASEPGHEMSPAP
jgi:outer membrane protein